ncbi:AbrB/MazE/SpoVT family DNA-binding domain-containing protein [Paenibacillus polygoni]|uniref:AbrB/MazE/SpoVT family DNA-binding domain-containing protein n=1 Tax=Paenibacillus polygoni TaxID=3050112 RepID=A0ABY8X6H8_9BACL|nr:AbrB/MazE/SpoVT family DNA-binding domain-containing protein [Paenibacillus polygoni]WIV19046.1 AbrB/MazE/SpoVT family DNA-binding domain-containing protein [Paenibacillus polygoni]
MKRTGMKRALDRLGRIVLPKEMRDTMEIDIGDPLEFFIEGKELILRKYKSTLCIFCGNVDTEMYFKEQFICKNCAKELKIAENLIDISAGERQEKTLSEHERRATYFIKPELSAKPNVHRHPFATSSDEFARDVRPKTAQMLRKMKEIIDTHPGISQNQIAEKLGISQGRVSQLKKLL